MLYYALDTINKQIKSVFNQVIFNDLYSFRLILSVSQREKTSESPGSNRGKTLEGPGIDRINR